ncbi:phenylacetate--CoA ligase family protein [Rhodovulum sp. DZ06]|uniref:phenylacetate--CoA ligase family protein n=1 Tax=Rhodovulum sp. DZ06 TaxID=3425126 RepID=UPI003D347269
MTDHYDALETRSADQRAADLAAALPRQVARAQEAPAMAALLAGVDPAAVTSREALAALPVTRKSALVEAQAAQPPFGGFVPGGAAATDHVFQSPGPIYEPGGRGQDWWRMGRALHAAGIGKGDVVQNCFSYHLTPAGMIFENGAAAVGATVLPAGVGQTELQVRAAADVGTTAYAGTPDFLKVILDKADEMGVALPKLKKAIVGGGALFPSLRQEYADRGIACLQGYATADVGSIGYETVGPDGLVEGMMVDEGVIVEIVRPGTGDPVADGEVGEVLVTTFNHDYPLIRFATGDMSAVLTGASPCGRTGMRIKGWMGRADQTAKIKGMFVRPEQVAELVARHPEIAKARVTVTRADEKDVMAVQVESAETSDGFVAAVAESVQAALKLRGAVEVVAPGSLPNDGKVIEDARNYD